MAVEAVEGRSGPEVKVSRELSIERQQAEVEAEADLSYKLEPLIIT